MKFPTENDPAGESPKDTELDELQRMVQENENALKRANRMISDLRKQLGGSEQKAAPKPRRKK